MCKVRVQDLLWLKFLPLYQPCSISNALTVASAALILPLLELRAKRGLHLRQARQEKDITF